MIRSILAAILLLLGAVLPVSAQVAYDRKARLLSATYDGVPLRDVLAEISRRTGITVYIDPTVEKNVYIERTKAPVDEVLNEIVKPLNNMLIYKGNEVVAVRIYDQSPADAMQKIDPRGVPTSAPSSVTAPSAPAAVRQEPPAASQERQEWRQKIRNEHPEKFEERKAERERLRKSMKRKRGGAGRPPEVQKENEDE